MEGIVFFVGRMFGRMYRSFLSGVGLGRGGVVEGGRGVLFIRVGGVGVEGWGFVERLRVDSRTRG